MHYRSINQDGAAAPSLPGFSHPPAVLEFHLLQRRPCRFRRLQLRLGFGDVIAVVGHDELALGDLHLKDEEVLVGEGHFRAGEIELPHPEETFVV